MKEPPFFVAFASPASRVRHGVSTLGVMYVCEYYVVGTGLWRWRAAFWWILYALECV